MVQIRYRFYSEFTFRCVCHHWPACSYSSLWVIGIPTLMDFLYINDSAKQPLQTYIYNLNIRLDYTTMSYEEIIALAETSDKTMNAAKIIVAMVPISRLSVYYRNISPVVCCSVQ